MAYKHDYDKILTRLTTILSRLNDGESLLEKDLAEEYNVSTRTIRRDFDRLLSFPIYKENKRWKMSDNFKLEKSNCIEDTIVLSIIDKLTQSVGAEFYSRSKKLLSKIKNDEYSPIYTKLNIEDISEKLKEVQLLEEAIKEQKIVNTIYNFEEYKKEINIKPLKIVNFEGFWYLIALDARNDRLKKYYLKNLSNIKIIDKKFTTSLEIKNLLENAVTIWFSQDNDPFEVKLHISKVATRYFKRKPISSNQILESSYKDGSMDISIKITHEMEILPIIKYWIPYVKIIEPKWIVDILEKELSSYLNK